LNNNDNEEEFDDEYASDVNEVPDTAYGENASSNLRSNDSVKNDNEDKNTLESLNAKVIGSSQEIPTAEHNDQVIRGVSFVYGKQRSSRKTTLRYRITSSQSMDLGYLTTLRFSLFLFMLLNSPRVRQFHRIISRFYYLVGMVRRSLWAISMRFVPVKKGVVLVLIRIVLNGSIVLFLPQA
nr:hypothetical protein [Tanacetum cinerariifolium]